MGDERFDIDVGYRDPQDPRDDFPEDKPSPAEYDDRAQVPQLTAEQAGTLLKAWRGFTNSLPRALEREYTEAMTALSLIARGGER